MLILDINLEKLVMQITIDTHKFVKFLSEKKHFTQEQAETLIEAATEYHNAYTKELATKKDIEDLKISTKKDIEDLKISTKKDIEDLRISTKKDIEDLRISTKRDIEDLKISTRKDMTTLELKLTIRLGGIAIACTGILLAGIPIIMKAF